MKIDPNLVKVGRIAFRVEGENWNVYWADPDTMVRAVFIASVKLSLVEDGACKAAFMTTMRQIVGQMIFDTLGVRPSWPEPAQPAPEHERTRE